MITNRYVPAVTIFGDRGVVRRLMPVPGNMPLPAVTLTFDEPANVKRMAAFLRFLADAVEAKDPSTFTSADLKDIN